MDIKELQDKVINFRDKRDWAQYHNPKDLAISISLEASELLEIFQWKNAEQVEKLKGDVETIKRVKEELGDILIYSLTLAHEFGFDADDLVHDKIQINDKKYPVEKVKGKSDKYTAY
ncbi:MAG: nucleotide pyrophosphohydrolase [Pseudomonadota bacterium]